MSTVRVDNFGPSSGGTSYSARGIAKAWVNFNGIGTIAARDSENVSSLTDNGTGIYGINFSNAMIDLNYAATASAGFSALHNAVSKYANSATTTSFDIGVCQTTSTDLDDDNQVSVSVLGDLA